MSADDPRVMGLELFAWVGEDELGSGRVGIKAGLVPAGYIPLVAIDRGDMEKLADQMNRQARAYGKKIRLCRFTFAGVVVATDAGQ